jgi:hypothetical protein
MAVRALGADGKFAAGFDYHRRECIALEAWNYGPRT